MPLGEAASFDEPKMGDPRSVLKYRLAVGLIAYENGTRCLHTKHLPFREFLFSSQISVAPVNAYEATELNAEISKSMPLQKSPAAMGDEAFTINDQSTDV